MIKKYSLIIISILFIHLSSHAQSLSQEEVKEYTKDCNDLVSYLEFSLNSIGENDLNPKEKDIIISNSYAKLFRDHKVQIEDDLVPHREAVTNKDVQAYLKDVDFFFDHVSFAFQILAVDLLQDEKNNAFFKIQTLRTINGRTQQNDSIYNEQVRFIEVAINANQRDLKIVSIYTTKINETEENIIWWNNLPLSWKEILGEKERIAGHISFSRVLNIKSEYILFEKEADTIAFTELELNDSDSLGMDFSTSRNDTLWITNDSLGEYHKEQLANALIRILAIKELNLVNRLDITFLDPISKLSDLHTLNISGTLVDDIYPIRNLVDLQDLNISNSQVTNLDALIYSMSLQSLNISNTGIYDLRPIENLSNLKYLNFAKTHVDDISPLAHLSALFDLNMQHTMVSDLQPLEPLKKLSYLYLDNCPVSNINSLSSNQELKIISCNNTMINSLKAFSTLDNLNILYCENTEIISLLSLNGKMNLKKIYCDNTLLGEQKALKFMNDNPHILVVYESRKLKKWFETLSQEWKKVFATYVNINLDDPSKEELHQIASISNIDISNNKGIKSLEPLSRIQNLKVLNANNTSINSVEALSELRELNNLDISYTDLTNISPIGNLHSLEYLDISFTKVDNIETLINANKLKKINIESTLVSSLEPISKLSTIRELKGESSNISLKEFEEFILKNNDCIVLYQSENLINWWDGLNKDWQQLFIELEGWNNEPDYIKLHHLVKKSKLEITNYRNLRSISPLREFKFIKELTINGTQLTDIGPITEFSRLQSINLSQNPIENLFLLGTLKNLNSINISNTPIEDLEWIITLTHLQYLDISGTQIKKLKPLGTLFMLESLIAYNTRVSKLSDLDDLVSLRSLKVYNTKLSESKVNKFKNLHPACIVDYF